MNTSSMLLECHPCGGKDECHLSLLTHQTRAMPVRWERGNVQPKTILVSFSLGQDCQQKLSLLCQKVKQTTVWWSTTALCPSVLWGSLLGPSSQCHIIGRTQGTGMGELEREEKKIVSQPAPKELSWKLHPTTFMPCHCQPLVERKVGNIVHQISTLIAPNKAELVLGLQRSKFWTSS